MDTTTTDRLSEAECWELLRGSAVGRLAVVDRDGRPDIFPVNHVVDLGTVVVRTAAGSKLAGATDRAVAFEVDGYDVERGAAWSVVVRGTARRERGEGPMGALDPRTSPLLPWHQGRKPWLLRVEPEAPGAVTGRRIAVEGGFHRDR